MAQGGSIPYWMLTSDIVLALGVVDLEACLRRMSKRYGRQIDMARFDVYLGSVGLAV
jgi:hypothetical protein